MRTKKSFYNSSKQEFLNEFKEKEQYNHLTLVLKNVNDETQEVKLFHNLEITNISNDKIYFNISNQETSGFIDLSDETILYIEFQTDEITLSFKPEDFKPTTTIEFSLPNEFTKYLKSLNDDTNYITALEDSKSNKEYGYKSGKELKELNPKEFLYIKVRTNDSNLDYTNMCFQPED